MRKQQKSKNKPLHNYEAVTRVVSKSWSHMHISAVHDKILSTKPATRFEFFVVAEKTPSAPELADT